MNTIKVDVLTGESEIIPYTEQEKELFLIRQSESIDEEKKLARTQQKITMRQARLLLLEKGLLDDIESHIAMLSKSAQIEWEYATEIKRDYPLVLQIAEFLSMSDVEMDEFFEFARLI